MATILEDFEDATLNLVITGTWARADDSAAVGTWSLKSADIDDDGATQAVVAVPAQATSLTFSYRVSSEEDFDLFHVLIDGVEVLTISGEIGWTPATFDVTGKSQVTFRYDKDGSVSSGGDAAWVDQIAFTVPSTDKSSSDNGTLTETATVAQAPEITKASSDIGHGAEARWAGEPQTPPGPPPSIRSTSTATSGSSSYSINAPAGVVANDVLIGVQAADRGSTANMTTPTGGTTWELLDSLDAISESGVLQVIRVWWKRAGSVEPSTYTFKQAATSDGVCLILAVKDASLTAAPKIVRLAAEAGNNVTTPGIAPTSGTDLEIRIAAGYAIGIATTLTPPDGFSPPTRVQSRVYTLLAAAGRTLQSNAETAPLDFIASVNPLEWRAGYTLAVAPAVTGPPQEAKTASDSGGVVESGTVVEQPDGIPVSASDNAALAEAASATADTTSTEVAALGEVAAVDGRPGSADQAALAEASMLELGWSSADQAHLTDTAQVDAQAASVDGGALAELVDIAKTIGPVSGDAGMLAEATAVNAEAASADTGTLTEARMLELGQGSADQALLAETAQVDAHPASVDGGALAETADVAKTIGPVSNDGAALTEVATVETQVTAADTGALTASAVAAVVKESTDAGQFVESVSTGLVAADAATLIESAAAHVVIAAFDSASLADASSIEAPKFATDAAVLVEQSEVIDIGRAIVGAGLVRRGWSAHSPRRRWAVGTPRRAWRADSPHT